METRKTRILGNMIVSVRLVIVALSLTLVHAQIESSDPAGVLGKWAIARFAGSGADSIQAMSSDAAGNVYIAGTTSSPDLPMKNAMQPVIGEVPLMRSTDRGETWQKIDGIPVQALEIAPHPVDPRVLLLAGATGIYKSSDSGQTWRQVHSWKLNVTATYDVLNIAIDPANPSQVYAAYVSISRMGVFLRSANGGETWDEPPSPTFSVSGDRPPNFSLSGARQLWVDPRGSGAVMLGLAISRDRGQTWKMMASPPKGTHQSIITPDPHRTGWIYAATATGGSGYLYLSGDWGATWTEKTPPNSWSIDHLVVDPELSNTLYASTAGRLYVSRDGAASWQPITETGLGLTGFGRLAFMSRQCMGGALLSISGGAVVSSPDLGGSWTPPQLTLVRGLTAGPGCVAYAVRSWTSDAFIMKLSPQGDVLWCTYLGGADRDASVSVSVGPGGVYVGGNTASLDFPATVPRLGGPGRQNVFVVKLDVDGTLVYSAVFGGEATDWLTALSVESEGYAYLAGTTGSKSFPATAGAFQVGAPAANSGFAVRLAPDGQLVYATYLPYRLTNAISSWPFLNVPSTPLAVAGEADGSALIGGNGGTLSRLSADGSTLTPVSQMPGQIHFITNDSQGDVYVAGQITGPTASKSCLYGFVFHQTTYLPPADIFVTKLRSGSFDQLYAARLSGDCRAAPTAIKVGASGEVTLGLWTFGGFPLRNPVLAYSSGRAAISRLSRDGSELLFSTYVPTYANPAAPGVFDGARAIALGVDDSLYAGVTSYSAQSPEHAAVLQLPVSSSLTLSINSIFHTLSGYQSVMPGSLVTISGQGVSPSWMDLGLNFPDPLPIRLGGVQVLFDDIPAEMFQVASGHLICVPPPAIKDKHTVNVQVVNESERSTPFVVRVDDPSPELLTRSFPSPPPSKADGEIRNADGTSNSEANPAARASTIKLFATGLSGPGPVQLYWAPQPYVPTPLPPPGPRGPGPVYGNAETMPGFIRALYAITFRIPDAFGPGVDYLPPTGVVTRVEIALGNTTVGVYVK